MAPKKTMQKSAKKRPRSGVKKKNVTKVVTHSSETPNPSNSSEPTMKSRVQAKPVLASMAMARATAQTCKEFFKLTPEQYQQERRYIRSYMNIIGTKIKMNTKEFNTLLEKLWERPVWAAYRSIYNGDALKSNQASQCQRQLKFIIQDVSSNFKTTAFTPPPDQQSPKQPTAPLVDPTTPSPSQTAPTVTSSVSDSGSRKRGRDDNEMERIIKFHFVDPDHQRPRPVISGKRKGKPPTHVPTPSTDTTWLSGLSMVALVPAEETFERIFRLAVEKGLKNRKIRALYGCTQTLTMSEPSVADTVAISTEDDFSTFMLATSGMRMVSIMVVYGRGNDRENAPTPDGGPLYKLYDEFQLFAPLDSDPEQQVNDYKRRRVAGPRSINGFQKKVRIFADKIKEYTRLIQVLRNHATYLGMADEICFFGEACFDSIAPSTPRGAQAREKAVWVEQGSSNRAYCAYREANPLTKEELAADLAEGGYKWSLNPYRAT
jgi:hypothetical protein